MLLEAEGSNAELYFEGNIFIFGAWSFSPQACPVGDSAGHVAGGGGEAVAPVALIPRKSHLASQSWHSCFINGRSRVEEAAVTAREGELCSAEPHNPAQGCPRWRRGGPAGFVSRSLWRLLVTACPVCCSPCVVVTFLCSVSVSLKALFCSSSGGRAVPFLAVLSTPLSLLSCSAARPSLLPGCLGCLPLPSSWSALAG